jgi:DNA-binding NtrC family response regulator
VTHAEAQIVSRMVFLAWEHREEDLREETGKLWVDGAATPTEVEHYENEARQHQLARINLDREWQHKLVARELQLDDLRQRCAQLELDLRASKKEERIAKARANGYRSLATKVNSEMQTDGAPSVVLPIMAKIRAAEFDAVSRALKLTQGNKSAAARMLDMSLPTFLARLRLGAEDQSDEPEALSRSPAI